MDIKLNEDEYEALCNVVDYIHDEEYNHYSEQLSDGRYDKTHIWHSVKTLSLMLKEYQMKGEISE